jgi:hypothetical protein
LKIPKKKNKLKCFETRYKWSKLDSNQFLKIASSDISHAKQNIRNYTYNYLLKIELSIPQKMQLMKFYNCAKTQMSAPNSDKIVKLFPS